jgi:hypothetical protein
MSLLGGLKDKTGEYLLKKEAAGQKRRAVVSNLKTATKIGLLYYADDEASHKKVQRYVKHLKEEEGIRTLMALGYSNEKETPAYLNSKLEFDHFTVKDTNWKGRPTGATISNFVDEDYDILVDLSLTKILPLRFVLLHSKAKFKVGRFAEENELFYDLMIDVKDDDLDQFIKQINHYLKIINNGDGN